MNDAHHRGVWDAPEIGRRYHDHEGGQFLVFSVTGQYIYIEYGSGDITILCRPEWPRLEPREIRPLIDRPVPRPTHVVA